MAEPQRCPWATSNPRLLAYHDEEWGVPEHRDPRLFELLTLEGAQAGLSWDTVLRKRENYRRALNHFDPTRVAAYTDADAERLLGDPGLIRNRRKVESILTNAQCFLAVQEEMGSFDRYIWTFVQGQPLQHRFTRLSQLPAHTPESAAMSRALKGRGFRFVGPTICYAFMQATGLVNDHLVDCFRYPEVQKAAD